MTKAETTRQHILEATATVFNKKGYAGAALSELCDVTGLTKGALYGHFSSKEELAVASFQYMMLKVKSSVRQELDRHSSARQKLLALLNFYAAYVYHPPVEGGCPLLNTAIQMDDDKKNPLRKAVAEELKQTVAFIANLIRQGQQAREFKKSVDSNAYAHLFFCAIEGAIMVARVSPTDEAMANVVRLCNSLVNNIRNN